VRTRYTTLCRLLTAAGVALLAAGCAMTGTSTNMNQVAARDLAVSVSDPTSGTTEEITDLGSFLFTEAAGGRPWALFHAADFALFLTDGALANQLAWSSMNNDYELTRNRSVTAGSISGMADVTIAVAFFTSTDASGTGVQITPLTSGASTSFSGIHSLTYHRQMSGSFSNTASGLKRQLTSTSSFTVTNVNEPSGFTINGTKTVSFDHTYPDGKTISGTINENVTNVVVTAVLQGDGTYLVTATGTIMVDYSATITQANGTTTQVSKTATITLNGQRIVHVDMDGTDVDVDMTTGEAE